VGRGKNAQNEANSGGGFRCEVSSVKQIVRNEPNLPPAAPGSAGLIVRNEANSAANRAKRTQLGGPIVRNKANSPEAGRDGQGPAKSPMPAPRDQSVRNKANSAQAAGRTSTLWKKTYGELNMQETSVKQSQFAPGRLGETLGRGRKCCHGRAQACKTKPILAPGRHNGSGIRHRMPAAPGMHPFAGCRLRRPAISAIRAASFGVSVALMKIALRGRHEI